MNVFKLGIHTWLPLFMLLLKNTLSNSIQCQSTRLVQTASPFFSSHQLPTALQVGMGSLSLFPTHAGILVDLVQVLQVGNNRLCEFINAE